MIMSKSTIAGTVLVGIIVVWQPGVALAASVPTCGDAQVIDVLKGVIKDHYVVYGPDSNPTRYSWEPATPVAHQPDLVLVDDDSVVTTSSNTNPISCSAEAKVIFGSWTIPATTVEDRLPSCMDDLRLRLIPLSQAPLYVVDALV